MKNIQIIDGAENCVYDIYTVSDEDFKLIFPNKQDIEFIDDLILRINESTLNKILEKIWRSRISKKNIAGIHGTLFYELSHKKKYYPTKIDEEAINPDGSKLRPEI